MQLLELFLHLHRAFINLKNIYMVCLYKCTYSLSLYSGVEKWIKRCYFPLKFILWNVFSLVLWSFQCKEENFNTLCLVHYDIVFPIMQHSDCNSPLADILSPFHNTFMIKIWLILWWLLKMDKRKEKNHSRSFLWLIFWQNRYINKIMIIIKHWVVKNPFKS